MAWLFKNDAAPMESRRRRLLRFRFAIQSSSNVLCRKPDHDTWSLVVWPIVTATRSWYMV